MEAFGARDVEIFPPIMYNSSERHSGGEAGWWVKGHEADISSVFKV